MRWLSGATLLGGGKLDSETWSDWPPRLNSAKGLGPSPVLGADCTVGLWYLATGCRQNVRSQWLPSSDWPEQLRLRTQTPQL